jgi:hypothetical protein
MRHPWTPPRRGHVGLRDPGALLSVPQYNDRGTVQGRSAVGGIIGPPNFHVLKHADSAAIAIN